MSVCKYHDKTFTGNKTLYPSIFHDYMILISDDGRCILGRSLEDTESITDYSGRLITIGDEVFIVLEDNVTYANALTMIDSYRDACKQVSDYFKNMQGADNDSSDGL